MKITMFIAAAGLALGGIAGSATASAAPASASVQDYGRHGDYRDNDRRDNRRWDRGRHRGWDNNRSYRRNYRGRAHRVCWTEWRRYQGRVTVCRRR